MPVLLFRHQFRVEAKPQFGLTEQRSINVGSVGAYGSAKERLSSLMETGNKLNQKTIAFTLGLEKIGSQTSLERKIMADKVKSFSLIPLLRTELKSKGFLSIELDEVLEEILDGSEL